MYKTLLLLTVSLLLASLTVVAQKRKAEMGITMQQYIEENHLEKIEEIIHSLAYSKTFLDQFIEEEERHLVDVSQIKRKDVKVGKDVDIEVRHFTEHQTFTLVLVPISVYSLAIYDTLLFSVIEVSDEWLEREFPYENHKDDSVKSSILSLKNHDLLAAHLYDQALTERKSNVGQFKVHLQESFISTNSIHEHMGHMTKNEKETIRKHWGGLKKALSHHVNLNVEFNIYVFGFNDLEILCKDRDGDTNYKITPNNVFHRHNFVD